MLNALHVTVGKKLGLVMQRYAMRVYLSPSGAMCALIAEASWGRISSSLVMNLDLRPDFSLASVTQNGLTESEGVLEVEITGGDGSSGVEECFLSDVGEGEDLISDITYLNALLASKGDGDGPI